LSFVESITTFHIEMRFLDTYVLLIYSENQKPTLVLCITAVPGRRIMPTVKVWGRGQLTIPSSIRKELHLDEEGTMTLVKIGDVLLLTPQRLLGDEVAKKAARTMKKAGLKLEDLLADLSKQRTRYNRERYGG
jgi:bifunctional DNA-binding transcriptional regulator/antitoxin component of YhaV-PrlF toxin-antitoxin module